MSYTYGLPTVMPEHITKAAGGKDRWGQPRADKWVYLIHGDHLTTAGENYVAAHAVTCHAGCGEPLVRQTPMVVQPMLVDGVRTNVIFHRACWYDYEKTLVDQTVLAALGQEATEALVVSEVMAMLDIIWARMRQTGRYLAYAYRDRGEHPTDVARIQVTEQAYQVVLDHFWHHLGPETRAIYSAGIPIPPITATANVLVEAPTS